MDTLDQTAMTKNRAILAALSLLKTCLEDIQQTMRHFTKMDANLARHVLNVILIDNR